MPISRQQLVNELLPSLEKLFNAELNRIDYHMRCRYGKYSIYKWEYKDGKRTSTTLASKVDRELAVGMMKLLKEPNENNNNRL
jgi:hypothetical protein